MSKIASSSLISKKQINTYKALKLILTIIEPHRRTDIGQAHYLCFKKFLDCLKGDNRAKFVIEFIKKDSIDETVLCFKKFLLIEYSNTHSIKMIRLFEEVSYDFLFSFVEYLYRDLNTLFNCVAIRCIRDNKRCITQLCHHYYSKICFSKELTEMIGKKIKSYDFEFKRNVKYYIIYYFNLIKNYVYSAHKAYEICCPYVTISESDNVDDEKYDYDDPCEFKAIMNLRTFNNFIACNHEKITDTMTSSEIIEMFCAWEENYDSIFIPKDIQHYFI